MTIHPHDDLLRAARAQARTPEFRQAYPTRSSIERTIAWTATQNGRRVKLRYLGTTKNDAWLHTRCSQAEPADPGQRRADPLRRGLGPDLTRPAALRRTHIRPPGRASRLSAGHHVPRMTETGAPDSITGHARRQGTERGGPLDQRCSVGS